jgi:hypothetical protein
MWEPQPLATIRASTACTGINLPYCRLFIKIPHREFCPPFRISSILWHIDPWINNVTE